MHLFYINIFLWLYSEESLGRRGSVLTPLPGPGSFKRKNPFKSVFAGATGGCPAGFGRG